MWWGFKYLLYFFGFVFVFNIFIQLIIGEDSSTKVKRMKAEMRKHTMKSGMEPFSPQILPQKEIFGDWFGFETLSYKWLAITNIFSSLLIYLDYFTQKIMRGIYADFVFPLLRI